MMKPQVPNQPPSLLLDCLFAGGVLAILVALVWLARQLVQS